MKPVPAAELAVDVWPRELPLPPPILVVDDEPGPLAHALLRLVAAGYATSVAHDGDGALHRVRTLLTRLVISELYIPCAEGPCLVAALKRERARIPRLLVLVHTRHVSAKDEAWALATGADVVLHKSAGIHELVRETRRLLREDAETASDITPELEWGR